jgi:hypothetical protein
MRISRLESPRRKIMEGGRSLWDVREGELEKCQSGIEAEDVVGDVEEGWRYR